MKAIEAYLYCKICLQNINPTVKKEKKRKTESSLLKSVLPEFIQK